MVAGNWKMNHGPDEARAFAEALDLPASDDLDVVLFPPSLSLLALRESLEAKDAPVALGVQHVHYEKSGAFTGELSAGMAAEAGARYALVGHSERRHIFGETDDQVRRKVHAVLEAGLVPVLCVGETVGERKAGRLEEVLARQLGAVVSPDAIQERMDAGQALIVAYEPVWAIGTGETATPDDASQAHRFLRGRLREWTSAETAARTPILYGGSVKPENAAELLSAPEVDGVLVGGASLDPDSFTRIVAAVGTETE
jgi:triosephosphate isomerase (TIM)